MHEHRGSGVKKISVGYNTVLVPGMQSALVPAAALDCRGRRLRVLRFFKPHSTSETIAPGGVTFLKPDDLLKQGAKSEISHAGKMKEQRL